MAPFPTESDTGDRAHRLPGQSRSALSWQPDRSRSCSPPTLFFRRICNEHQASVDLLLQLADLDQLGDHLAHVGRLEPAMNGTYRCGLADQVPDTNMLISRSIHLPRSVTGVTL